MWLKRKWQTREGGSKAAGFCFEDERGYNTLKCWWKTIVVGMRSPGGNRIWLGGWAALARPGSQEEGLADLERGREGGVVLAIEGILISVYSARYWVKSPADREACGDQRRERGVRGNSCLEKHKGEQGPSRVQIQMGIYSDWAVLSDLSHMVAQPQVQQRGAVGFTRGLAGMFTERVMKGQRGKGFGE